MEFLSDLKGFRRNPIRDQFIESLDYAFEQNSPDVKVYSFLKLRNNVDVRGKIHVVGFGKAGIGMFEGAKRYFGDRIASAQIIVPFREGEELKVPFLPGNHPFPKAESIRSSETLVSSLKGLNADDLVVALVSGGGSSLFEVLEDGVDIEGYNDSIECLMRNGANISELNAVRYLSSKVKGGGLLDFTYPARVLSLIISDVPGDSVDTVASGPTGAPPDGLEIDGAVKKFGRGCRLPQVVAKKTGRKSAADNNLILKNQDFVRSIVDSLSKRGFTALNIGSGISGDTSTVAKMLVNGMRSGYRKRNEPLFLVGGGETSTVFVHHGIGGRNLELCLRVLLLMKREEDFTFGSIGTDGIDGTSNAMGAIVDNETVKYVDRNFMKEELSTSNSLAPLVRSQDVLYTGPTGNNVSDIFIAYYAGSE